MNVQTWFLDGFVPGRGKYFAQLNESSTNNIKMLLAGYTLYMVYLHLVAWLDPFPELLYHPWSV